MARSDVWCTHGRCRECGRALHGCGSPLFLGFLLRGSLQQPLFLLGVSFVAIVFFLGWTRHVAHTLPRLDYAHKARAYYEAAPRNERAGDRK